MVCLRDRDGMSLLTTTARDDADDGLGSELAGDATAAHCGSIRPALHGSYACTRLLALPLLLMLLIITSRCGLATADPSSPSSAPGAAGLWQNLRLPSDVLSILDPPAGVQDDSLAAPAMRFPRFISPLREAVQNVNSELLRVAGAASFAYGERTTPASLRPNLSEAVQGLILTRTAQVSKQLAAMQAKIDTLTFAVTETRRTGGSKINLQTLMFDILFLFCSPTALQRPGPVPGAKNGMLVVATIETGSCVLDSVGLDDMVSCIAPRIEIEQIRKNFHMAYTLPAAVVTPQCGQGIMFGEVQEISLFERGAPQTFDSIHSLVETLTNPGMA